MRKLQIVSTVFSALLACMLSWGCSNDDPLSGKGSRGGTDDEVNDWVYDAMKKNYLWADFMPAEEYTDLDLNPIRYFNDELRYQDPAGRFYSDRFSSIVHIGPDISTNTSPDTRTGYTDSDYVNDLGMLAASVAMADYFIVLYTTPGSPAWNAGIRRGDCFNMVNGKTDTAEIFLELEEPETAIRFIYPEEKYVTVRSASYLNTPILHYQIYDSPFHKTGYIAYNHFSSGDDDRFFNQLKDIFNEFSQAGVSKLVVDLRYNGGGEITAACQLASLLVPNPAANLEKPYLYLEDNESYGKPGKFEAQKLLGNNRIGSANPGITDIYYIVTGNTASASELIIHCLRPFFEDDGVGESHIVGHKTVGKNVGGFTITNTRYQWELHPITVRIYDRNKVSGYERGLDPDIVIESEGISVPFDNGALTTVGAFGDMTSEKMLRAVFAHIYYGSPAMSMSAGDLLDGESDGAEVRASDGSTGSDFGLGADPGFVIDYDRMIYRNGPRYNDMRVD